MRVVPSFSIGRLLNERFIPHPRLCVLCLQLHNCLKQKLFKNKILIEIGMLRAFASTFPVALANFIRLEIHLQEYHA